MEVARNPNELDVSIDKTTKKITVEAKAPATTVGDGKVILFFFTEGKTITAVLNYKFGTKVSTIAGAQSYLSSNTNKDDVTIVLTEDIGTNDILILPNTTESQTRTIVLESVTTNSILTVKEETQESAEA